MPGTMGPDGKMIRWSNIGGQPFVLTTWTTDVQTKEAVEFVKWWLSPDIQNQFAAAGGQSAIKAVYIGSQIPDLPPVEQGLGAVSSIGRRTCGTCRSSSSC